MKTLKEFGLGVVLGLGFLAGGVGAYIGSVPLAVAGAVLLGVFAYVAVRWCE